MKKANDSARDHHSRGAEGWATQEYGATDREDDLVERWPPLRLRQFQAGQNCHRSRDRWQYRESEENCSCHSKRSPGHEKVDAAKQNQQWDVTVEIPQVKGWS